MMLDRIFRQAERNAPIERAGNAGGPSRVAKRRGVALALGGGAARGWAHIGVLRALDEADIPISMIAGTSIGALVGGCYLAGRLDELEAFARSLTRRGLMGLLDFRFGGDGLLGGMRLNARLVNTLKDVRIEDLDRPFVAVATEGRNGHEVWMDQGSLVLAMRASYAVPGIFQPVECGGRRLSDGALVNPVPVSVCRAYEQPLVIAVNLHYDLFGRAAVLRMRAESSDPDGSIAENPVDPLSPQRPNADNRRDRIGFARSVVDAFNIIQDRISRSRLAGDPPDLSVHPRVREIGLSEFFRAKECIAFGYEETMRSMTEIRRLQECMPAP